MDLKTIQRYRNTIFICIILLALAAALGLINMLQSSNNKAPLNPTPIGGSFKNQDVINPKWEDINLGTSKTVIDKEFGTPTRKDTQGEITILTYLPNPNTLRTHQIFLKGDKVVGIKRRIDSFNDTVRVEQYIEKYGNPEQIKEQLGPDSYSLQMYKRNNNEYLVLEVDKQNNKVYTLYLFTKEQYESFKNSLSKPNPDEEKDNHENFDVEAI